MSGYVRIHRSLIGHPAFRNDAEAMAFAWLVAKAAWKPTRVRYKERAIMLGRGQLAISQRDMARALDRDKAWIERLWKRLKAEAMIEVVCEAGVGVITVCNYVHYQANSVTREAVDEAPQEAGARQGQGTEQVREEVKEISSEAKASSLREKFPPPPDVSIDQWRAFRQQRKKALTDRAYLMICNKLAELAEDGWPPGEMIDRAIEHGWETAFAPRKQTNEQHGLQRPRTNPTLDLLRAANAEIARSEGGEDHIGTRLALPAANHC